MSKRQKKQVKVDIKGKKCQNRHNKKCILYNGHWKYYTNAEDLARQLTISVRAAKSFIEENGDRIALGPTNDTLKFNIKKDNFKGLLRDFLGIKRVEGKKIIADIGEIPSRGTTIMKQVNPIEIAKWIITITLFITFRSPYTVTKNMLMSNGKINYVKIQGHINAGALVERQMTVTFEGKGSDVENFVHQKSIEYVVRSRFGSLVYYEYTAKTSYNRKKVDVKNGTIKDFDNVYELSEWCNIEYRNNFSKKDTCAVKLISQRYPELYWDIKKIETRDGVIVKDFMDFCKENGIGYRIYSERSKLLFFDKGEFGIITCIIYNGHIYAVNGGKPRRFSRRYKKIILPEDDSLKYLKSILDKKILPHGMKVVHKNKKYVKKIDIDKIDFVDDEDGNFKIEQHMVISPIIHGNKKIICNDEYHKCLAYLKKMGYEKYITDDIKVKSIPSLLEKILRVPETTSFIPEKDIFKTAPLLWKTDKKIYNSKVKTIDKNKCYAFALYSLPYLIIFDYRKNKINVKPTKIIDSFLYLARPSKYSTYMPETKLYAGYHLNKCKTRGIEFELLEELETEIKPNYFRKIIKLTYKHMEEKDFKDAWNIFIGKMERSSETIESFRIKGIYDDESIKAFDGNYEKIGDMNILYDSIKKYMYVRDRLPIATQIKDMSRMILCDKIIDLGLSDDQIVQINTDSISYYGELPEKLDPKLFSGWKCSDFKELGNIDNCYDNDISAIKISSEQENIRILYKQYAGSGKTTKIVNELIPKILKMGKTYIVLTPTHKTLDDYRLKGLNCEIFQKYSLSNTIPDYDYIIVDEIGFVDHACHDVLYNINRVGKNYICFGDFSQLLPVHEDIPLDQEHYLNYMFDEINTYFINYRNNFTKEYYDKLINAEPDVDNNGIISYPFLIKEVKKWSCDRIEDAEYILCYRCRRDGIRPDKIPTRTHYNNLMLEKLGFKKMNEVGVRIFCKNNNLISQKIYNNKLFTIVKIKEDDENINIYTLKDENDNIFHVGEKKLLSNFIPAYCINIHQAQGMTLKSYYWASEDDNFLYGRCAYTIISRLQQELKFSIGRELAKLEMIEKLREKYQKRSK